MGRGLSPLQRWMLDELHQRPDGRLYYAEVYVGYYGWNFHGWGGKVRSEDGRFHGYGQCFYSWEIGAEKYRSGKTAVSRSAHRLADRELVYLLEDPEPGGPAAITTKPPGEQWPGITPEVLARLEGVITRGTGR